MEMESSGGSSSYYSILGVGSNSSDEEIRRAYRKLAMQWHPDKWTRTPRLLNEAKRRFQQIQEAYSVLSDRSKRTLYDAGLYDPDDDDDDEEDDTGFADFLQEMVSLMEDVKREERTYSMEDLQSMFWEMAQGFESTGWSSFPQAPLCESPPWFCSPAGNLGRSARDSSLPDRNSHLHLSGLEMYGAR